MTDDEVDSRIGDAILEARVGLGNTCAAHRVIFFAGMREAARIAREHEFARTAAAAIERAAGGEE